MEELYLSCKKCGLINSYEIIKKGNHHTAFCSCGAYIKNVAYDTPKLYIGKYKGTPICDITDLHYLEWFFNNVGKISASTRGALQKQIDKLKKPI